MFSLYYSFLVGALRAKQLHIIVQKFPLAQMFFGSKENNLPSDPSKISIFKMAAGRHIGFNEKGHLLKLCCNSISLR